MQYKTNTIYIFVTLAKTTAYTALKKENKMNGNYDHEQQVAAFAYASINNDEDDNDDDDNNDLPLYAADVLH